MPTFSKAASLLAAFPLLAAATPALAAISGTATISSVPNGPNFDYTIQLTNPSGSGVNIATFWFAWTPPGQPTEYDFLPSTPTLSSNSQPTGWIGSVSPGFPGTSIEYYNSTGSTIAPGATATFKFSSPDSPLTLQSKFLGIPYTESFVYASTAAPGITPAGTGGQVNPIFVSAAPEPASLSLLAAASLPLLLRRRRPH